MYQGAGVPRTLADIWEDLSVEERLLIFFEHSKLEDPQVLHPRYVDALKDIRHYVLDGHPLPMPEEI